ncbi:MAG: endolytic transglycosylase MltG [Candidatus Magasanikbacteria bacterium]|nr:endolytic transglycosylase MltG [Candidatus Magasanikbacteria bacterium]
MKQKGVLLFVISVLGLCFLAGTWFFYTELYTVEAWKEDTTVRFEVKEGETAADLAWRLEEQGIIRHAWLFKMYLRRKGLDTQIARGNYELSSPITLKRVVEQLSHPSTLEREITIIPGWDFRDIASYFEEEKIATREDFYAVAGTPALLGDTNNPSLELGSDIAVLFQKPAGLSFEGYISPNTYRIFKDALIQDIVLKLIKARYDELNLDLRQDIKKSERSFHEILTMASIVEREVRNPEDRALAADIFWRRHDVHMGLQADSAVHYAVGKKGDIFTTKEDRDSSNSWNTYKYPSLPPGPISNPSLESIRAVLYPTKNEYWYFLTTVDTGEVKYARTLEEHNKNAALFLKR